MQQTIKFPVSHIIENSDDDTGDFLPTNFDVTVNEFIDACIEDFLMPVGKTVLMNNEHIVCIIDFREMVPDEKEQVIKMKAQKTGIITDIKNVKFNA